MYVYVRVSMYAWCVFVQVYEYHVRIVARQIVQLTPRLKERETGAANGPFEFLINDGPVGKVARARARCERERVNLK